MAVTISDRDAIGAAFARLRAARDEVSDLCFDTLTASERLELLGELEVDRRRQPAVEHRLIHGLCTESRAGAMGGANWRDVLAQRLRINIAEARRRLDEADDLGPRTTLSGEQLEPRLPNVAKRQAGGELNAEHVRIIRTFFSELPAAVDHRKRESCEDTLAQLAAEHTPEVLRKAAQRLAAHVNPDGTFDDHYRAQRRGLTIGPQDIDGVSAVRGNLDPEARAVLDAVLAKLAAPGMCDPDNENPCVEGEPGEKLKRADRRTQAQRNHDGLKAMCRAMLASGDLGRHKGLPVSLIVSTTLQELESGTGQAVTGGGSVLPMRDVIQLASQSHHYLVIFDGHTQEPLYLGRAKRLASPGQRIVLHARDRGCTRPGCTVPGYWCEVHHVDESWAAGGNSDITNEGLACGPDNRLVEEGWTTRRRKDGRIEWIPPPHLDRGQPRVNDYHHPERLLAGRGGDDEDDDEDEP